MKNNIIKLCFIIGILLSIVYIVPVNANAEIIDSGSCGENVVWMLDEGGTLTLSGTGDMINYTSSNEIPWNQSSVTSVKIEDGVTSIGHLAFCLCENMTSVSIPNTIKSIGVGAFSNCSSVETIVIPDSVVTIGNGAFDDCFNLQSMTIGSGVTDMGTQPICDFDLFPSKAIKLTNINVSEENTAYSSENGILFNKDKTELIKYPANRNETSYTVPLGVVSIRENAFQFCYNLTHITLSNGVISVGEAAFYVCQNLKSMTIPNTITNVGNSAFNTWATLRYVYYTGSEAEWNDFVSIMSNDSTITNLTKATYKFFNFKDLLQEGCYTYVIADGEASIIKCDTKTTGDIIIPEVLQGCSVTSICGEAFYSCDKIQSITIPDSVTNIGNAAFMNCSNLISVEIPDSITSIGSRAFESCKSLNTVILSKGMAAIEQYTFSGCTSLVNITIPSSITDIGYNAFLGCESLKRVGYNGTEEQWNTINIVDGNSKLINAEDFFFNYDFIAKSDCFYYVVADGEASIIGCDTGTTGDIIIPEALDGFRVTSIYERAFRHCQFINNVVISYGITKIGVLAFGDCNSLLSILIPDSVVSIGSSAFYNCRALQNITIPDSVFSIEPYTFYNCISLNNIYFKNIISIAEYAFYNCTSMAEMIIPESTTRVSLYAFYNCLELTDIVYEGNGEQWEQLNIVKAGNDPLLNANIHFLGDEVGSKVLMLSSLKVFTFGIVEKHILVIASYKNSELLDVKLIEVSEDITKTIAEIGVNTNGANTIKAFLWDDIQSMSPVCEAQSISIG